GGGLDLDLAAVEVDQGAGDGEAEAAAGLAAAVGRAAIEAVEDQWALRLGDTGAAVGHGQADQTVDRPSRDLGPATGRGAAGGVGREMGRDLRAPPAVAEERREAARQVELDGLVAGVEQAAERGDGAADQAGRVERLDAELDPAGFEAAEVE